MKVDINSAGQLVIRPETELEVYALRHWWDEWNNQKSTLRLDLDGKWEFAYPDQPE